MHFYTFCLLIVVFARLLTLLISKRNEEKLKKVGAREFGRFNTGLLISAHFLFYGFCLFEGLREGFEWDSVSAAGLALLTASIAMLYYVIYSLHGIWTVKLIIGPPHYHTLNRGPLFRLVRHPNYYLNVIPELLAVGILFHAWICLSTCLPAYLLILAVRIRQEEKLMSSRFPDY